MKFNKWITIALFISPLTMAQKDYTNSIGMEFVHIPSGTFTMGGDPYSSETDKDEVVHQVTITKAFYLGKYEVTQEQWYQIMGYNPAHFKREKLGFDSRKNPVEQVSWEDLQKFINKLNEKEGGHPYRLPTEAEWEYACRAGSTGKYCFGDNGDLLKQYAWYETNSGGKTHSVGQKKPNAWGLYDMHGNVWELCQDWYGTSDYQTSPKVDPKGSNSGSTRVCRGGDWHNRARFCRSANRLSNDPSFRGNGLGFRLVRMIP